MNRILKISSVVHASLTQKGDCWTWNQRLGDAQVLLSMAVTFCHWLFFLFSRSKHKNANGIFV